MSLFGGVCQELERSNQSDEVVRLRLGLILGFQKLEFACQTKAQWSRQDIKDHQKLEDSEKWEMGGDDAGLYEWAVEL